MTPQSTVYCLIPAKPTAESKTRLASVLSAEERAALSRWLLVRTARLARVVVGEVVVVSRDRALLEDARAEGAWGLLETAPGLNPALTQAARFAGGRGAAGLLVLPADLPWLTAHDLEAMLAYIAPHPAPLPTGERGDCSPFSPLISGGEGGRGDEGGVVIAPCRHETGTNALLVRPPSLIPFAFGPDSFAAHCAAARAAGVQPVVYRSPTIALDLDTPEDWEISNIKSQTSKPHYTESDI